MPDGTPPPAAVRAYVGSLGERERERIGAEVLAAVRDSGYALANPFGEVDAGIRSTLAVSGVGVPTGTHVGGFPHGSLHARGHHSGDGTLILLDPGLRPLLDRIAGTLVAFQLTPAEPRERPRGDQADAAFAAAVAAFLLRDPPGPGSAPGTFGSFMARSAERFALGHEYGHLLAGHRHAPPGGDDRSIRQEYEADELAAMLILRGVDEGADFRRRALTVAGPFLLLAVEHLVNRVRGTADDAYPEPARRTAVLRRIFEQAGARGLLHFAEAWVSSLALREAGIVARALRPPGAAPAG